MKRLVLIAFAWLAVAGFALAQEPVCEWSMFESGTAILNTGTDGESGNLTLAEGAELSDDVPTVNTGGHALRLDGGEPTAAAESAAFFDPLAGAEKFTVMAWVRRESVSSASNQSARIFADYDGSGGVEFYFGGAPGYLQFRVNDKHVWTTAGFITPNNYSWHHVAVVYDSTRPATNLATRNVHFYIDGIQKGDGSTMDDVPTPNAVCAAIGNTSTDRSASTLLVGSIDNVLVFRDWAPEPSGKGNLNTAIRDWMLLDDSTRAPDEEEEDEHIVPPVIVEDLIAQKIGAERNYEDLKEGLIFINADDGELYFANADNPHGRAVCLFKGFPDWHSFTNTVRLNGHKLELNAYYSLWAESHALSARYGTNTVWTVVGEEWGDLAGLTVSLEDERTLMLSCNAVGPDVVLQVCTNLMEANRWKPATNMDVVAETDVATTWRVHLMMDQPGAEFYRVLCTGPSVAAGFHVYPELHPHGGIEMDGVLATNWGDVTNGVNARIAAHESATNPHGITAAGIGALTSESDTKALAAVGVASNALANRIGAAETNAQSFATRDWTAGYVATNHQSLDGYAKTEDVAAATNALSTEIAGVYATSSTVASVERRTGELESNAEEYWCKWDASILSDSTTNWIPIYDDWPARNITCFLYVGQMTNCVIAIPRNLKPEKDCHLRFVVSKTSTGNSGVGSLQSADGSEICSMVSGYNYRVWLLEWQSAITNWCILNYTLNTRPYSVRGTTMINYGYDFPTDRFSPVLGYEPGIE